MMSNAEECANEENTDDLQIRDYLVNTAVNFLLNPDVRKQHDGGKINFLKKKGLTDAEISVAFERVRLNSNYVNNTLVSSDQVNKFYQPASRPLHYQAPFTFWSRLSRLSSSLIVFGVAFYGLHHLFKKYLRPWFLGEDAEAELNDTKELTKNLALLAETIEKLHIAVLKQSDDINKMLHIGEYSPLILEDLKREVSSLKSILISRHQFPAIPQINTFKATIPSWQLPQDEHMLPAETETAGLSQKLENNDALTNASSLNDKSFYASNTTSVSLLPSSSEHVIVSEMNGLTEDNKVGEP